MSRLKLLILFILCAFSKLNFAQEITLFQQFNGHYDYTAIGNTLNVFENNIDTSFCETLPSSQADLLISSSTTIIAAYLYWAGSGQGDLEVNLNGIEISADDVYNVDYNDPNNGLLTYFSCYAEITDFIISQGSTNTTYELSNLDISNTINNNPGYCNNRTNFAGWSIYVVFEK